VSTKSNPYGLSSAGVFKEEPPEESISAHEKGFMESLWSSIYENPGDVWYDEEGNMHNKSPVAHAVAAVDNILPGLPFVDVFPDPPDFEQPLAKLELATLGAYGGSMLAGAARHPVQTAQKVKGAAKSMYESYRGLKDIHDVAGIRGLSEMYKGYNDAYKWAKKNPHKDFPPIRPLVQMLRTQTYDPVGVSQKKAMIQRVKNQFRDRPKKFVPERADAAEKRGYVEWNTRNLPDNLDDAVVRPIASHEVSHVSQGKRFGVEGSTARMSDWTKDEKGRLFTDLIPQRAKDQMGTGKVSEWKHELYDMLHPHLQKWHKSKFVEPKTVYHKDGSHSVTYPDKQEIRKHLEYLLNGDHDTGLDVFDFGREIQSRMMEIRGMLKIKNRNVTPEEMKKLIHNGWDEDKNPASWRLRQIAEEFKEMFKGEKLSEMLSKLNYILPAAVPLGIIPETDDEFLQGQFGK